MTVYLVTRPNGYRGHPPGSTFEATLNPGAEARALRRGDITPIHTEPPTIQPGSYTLPDGWPNQHEEVQ